MSAILIDTETTGLDEPHVIELAASEPMLGPDVDLLALTASTKRFKPGKPISLGAMAAHHIVESDLENEEPWPGAWSPPAGVEYLVAHNCDYDWKAIGSPHIARICTLALARSLWPDLDSHTLSALTYYHRGPGAREMLRGAHSAATDLILCAWLLIEILQAIPGMMSWHQLWIASEQARIPKYLSFGKYGPYSDWAKANNQPKGMPIAELKRLDRGYLSWLLSGKCDTVNDDVYLQKALRGEAL